MRSFVEKILQSIPEDVLSKNDIFVSHDSNARVVAIHEKIRSKLVKQIFERLAVFEYAIIKGISYLKPYGQFGLTRFSADIDILIKNDDNTAIHNILIQQGFEWSYHEHKNDNDALAVVNSPHPYNSHKLSYHKCICGFPLSIELHSGMYPQGDLHRVIENRIVCDTLYMQNEIDLFIISCLHLLHHSIENFSCLFSPNHNGIKQFIDVIVTYQTCLQKVGMQTLKKRAVELLADAYVSAAIEMCRGIFDSEIPLFPESTYFILRTLWKSRYYESHIMDRILHKERESKRLLDIYNTYLLTKGDFCLQCQPHITGHFDTPVVFDTNTQSNGDFWDHHWQCGSLIPQNQRIMFEFQKDNEFLIFMFKLEQLDSNQYAQVFIKYRNILFIFYLRPDKRNNITHLYYLSGQYEVSNHIGFTHNILDDDGCTYLSKIPWDILNITPVGKIVLNVECYFHLNVGGENYFDCHWYTGYGSDCFSVEGEGFFSPEYASLVVDFT